VFSKFVLCNISTKHNDHNIHLLQTEDTNLESDNRIYSFNNNKALSCNHCSIRETPSITYYKSVFVVFGMQHAMRRRHIVICVLLRSTIFFHVTSYKARFFKQKLMNKTCVVWFPLQRLLETFLIVSRIKRHMIKSVDLSSCTVPVILARF
jgi:hypothetical protein